jgi:hypothetical protein
MMDWTTPPCIVPVAFLLAVSAAGPAVGKDTLSVTTDVPLVPIASRNPGRNYVRLPTLEYQFEINTHCSDSRSPRSLSLNVADTRESLAAGKIIGDGPTVISLRIPASQIAPLVIEDFCVVQFEENGERISAAPTQTTIPAVLSAQVSLLCEGDEDKAITYVSRTLDVALVCDDVTDTEDESTGE